jgi:hypothetical protein
MVLHETALELEDEDITEHDYQKRLHIKGASEIILETCSHYLDEYGDRQVLDE